jgi:hypothetical protein
MTDEPDAVPLSPDEAAAYRKLGDGGPAPARRLEDRVVDALRARGLLARTRWTPIRLAGAVAAGLIVFMAGALWERSWPTASPRPAGTRFVLFLEEPQGPDEDVGEADLVREYSAWAREQRAAGRLVEGEKLEPAALTLKGDEAPVTASGSLPVVGGYFVVVADDLAGAVAVARTCPHLRHGGRIVIRPIASL